MKGVHFKQNHTYHKQLQEPEMNNLSRQIFVQLHTYTLLTKYCILLHLVLFK